MQRHMQRHRVKEVLLDLLIHVKLTATISNIKANQLSQDTYCSVSEDDNIQLLFDKMDNMLS